MARLTPHVPGMRDLGDYVREQRENAQLSVRQLSAVAGISNPYLSQIERGLRRPSADILNSLARGLQISAESLYVRAGLLDDTREASAVDVRLALSLDRHLTDRQRRIMLDLYDSFVPRDDPEDTVVVATPPSSGAAEDVAPARAKATAAPAGEIRRRSTPAPRSEAERDAPARASASRTTTPRTAASRTSTPRSTSARTTATRSSTTRTPTTRTGTPRRTTAGHRTSESPATRRPRTPDAPTEKE